MIEYWLQTGKAQFPTQLALGLSKVAASTLSALTASFSQPVTCSFVYSNLYFLEQGMALECEIQESVRHSLSLEHLMKRQMMIPKGLWEGASVVRLRR